MLTTFGIANAAQASPITLDFNNVPQSFANSLTDGFTLATDKNVTLGFGTPLAVFDLVEVAGGAFQFLGFDLGESFMGFPQADAISVTVTGFLSGSLVASQTFVLDGMNDGPGGLADFQSFVASGFTNVDRLVFLGNAGSQGRRFSMDNIPSIHKLSLLRLRNRPRCRCSAWALRA